MTPSPDQRSPMAKAAEWTSRVTTISMEMALPGLGGHWLDQRLGTGPVFLILGALLGLAAGMWHLLKLAAESPADQVNGPSEKSDGLKR